MFRSLAAVRSSPPLLPAIALCRNAAIDAHLLPNRVWERLISTIAAAAVATVPIAAANGTVLRAATRPDGL